MHQGQMQNNHREEDLTAPLVASVSSLLSPPATAAAEVEADDTSKESSTVTMKTTETQQVMIPTAEDKKLVDCGKLQQTEGEEDKKNYQLDEKLQTVTRNIENEVEHNDQPSTGEVKELPECEQDNDKNEPGELDEQSGIFDAANAELERKLIVHDSDVEPRESSDDNTKDDGDDRSSCQSASGAETLSRQVADAEALVAQQIDSIISMTTLKTITPLPVVNQTNGDVDSLSSSLSLSLSLSDDTDSNSVIKVQVTNDDDGADDNDEPVGHSESASIQNLRLLKMSASEDVLVCEQNRGAVEAARSMFQTLGRIKQQQQPLRKPKPVTQKKKLESQTKFNSGPILRSSSLSSSHESPIESGDDNLMENNNNNNNNNENPSSKRNHRQVSSTLDNQVYDVKIVRRSGSSLSTSGYRRTLVCSMSPTSQMGSGSDMSVQDTPVIYPIEGDEMLQCKNAFRENKRLIEQQQQENGKCNSAGSASTFSTLTRPHLSDSISSWTLRNKSNLTLPDCTHCNKKLYPVDKMELDFTKFTLNIHRNCFRCQVCSSMLRLETYHAIDAKLYCPAHVKYMMTTR